MADVTSIRSGNWNSPSTWNTNTVPVDGQTVEIVRGHRVTLNGDHRYSNGIGDIAVRGCLSIVSIGKLRLNGQLRVYGGNNLFAEGDTGSAGFFEMYDEALLEIRGDNSAQHCIWVENEKCASISLQGRDKNTVTNLREAGDIGDEYVAVDSVSGFGIGDWISLFSRNESTHVRGDEGAFIHDIDTTNNRLYLRQFVCPSDTITAASGNTLTISYANRFRVGYKVIFGTGSNRNVRTITAVNPVTNRLTLDANITGSVVGQVVYQTGLVKPKNINDATYHCQKVAAMASPYGASDTEIQVTSTAHLAVGDEILLPFINSAQTGWDYDTKRTITAISENTITIDSAIGYVNEREVAMPVLTRSVNVNAVDTSSNTRVFIYVEYWTSGDAYTRNLLFQNIRIKGLGRNTSSTYYGGFMVSRGNYLDKGNSARNFHSRIDSVVYGDPNNRSSYTGISTRHPVHFTVRNCVSYDSWYGYWNWSSTYNHRHHNNFATRNYEGGHANDAQYDPWTEFSFNYYIRNDNWGMTNHQVRGVVTNMYNKVVGRGGWSPFYFYYQHSGAVLYRWEMDQYGRAGFIGPAGGEIKVVDSWVGNEWTPIGQESGTGPGTVYSDGVYMGRDYYSSAQRQGSGKVQFIDYLSPNFESDSHFQSQGGVWREWQKEERYWRVWRCRSDSGDYGFIQQVYVPANTVVTAKAEIKMVDNYSGNACQLRAYNSFDTDSRGYRRGGYSDTTTDNSGMYHNSPIIGFREEVSFNTTPGVWQTREVTVAAKPFDYLLSVVVHNNNTNSREGWYQKDYIIEMTVPDTVNNFDRLQNARMSSQAKGIKIKKASGRGKRRLGGRI